MCHVSRVTCHMSRVMCHVSRVTCHMSRVTKKNGKSGGASRLRVCYQRGLPRLVLRREALWILQRNWFIELIEKLIVNQYNLY